MITSIDVVEDIAAGRISSMRLPHQRRPPRRGSTRPVMDSFTADPYCHVVITASHLSRRRTHAPGESCGALERTCTCPIIGHQATLDDQALAACGHPSLYSYATSWLLTHDETWLAQRAPDEPSTWMAALAAIETLTEAEVMTRWHKHWSFRSVWIVEWEVEHERPKLLAQPGRLRFRSLPSGRQVIDDSEDPLGDHGYTTRPDRALTGEPESIDANAIRITWRHKAVELHDKARADADRPPGNRKAS